MTSRTPQNVLLIHTDTAVQRVILRVLSSRGLRGVVTDDRAEAEEHLRSARAAMILVGSCDAAPATIEALAAQSPERPIVALGPGDDAPAAARAIQAGAHEYLPLPLQAEILDALLDVVAPNHEVAIAAEQEANTNCLYRLAGQSEPLRRTIHLARRVAASRLPVLITGESGTGKELLAYLIHHASRRGRNPYIRVNCASLSESLLESELFGHERGAFTGALRQRKGKFEMADGGTLLLDEISETGPRLQAELLRVLEQQDFHRVGGSESVEVDVRVICTSNRNLAEEVEDGRFRRDLYYRIRGVHLEMPALRDRLDDLDDLVWHFVNEYAPEAGRRVTDLDETMMARFRRCDWPGNVRQLRNLVRTALVLGEGATLSLDVEDAGLWDELHEDASAEDEAVSTLSLQDLERQAVIEALRRTNSHQAKAAQLLGISDRTLRDKLRRYREDGLINARGEESWSTSRAS